MKKRIFSFALVFTLLLAVVPAVLAAEPDDLTYSGFVSAGVSPDSYIVHYEFRFIGDQTGNITMGDFTDWVLYKDGQPFGFELSSNQPLPINAITTERGIYSTLLILIEPYIREPGTYVMHFNFKGTPFVSSRPITIGPTSDAPSPSPSPTPTPTPTPETTPTPTPTPIPETTPTPSPTPEPSPTPAAEPETVVEAATAPPPDAEDGRGAFTYSIAPDPEGGGDGFIGNFNPDTGRYEITGLPEDVADQVMFIDAPFELFHSFSIDSIEQERGVQYTVEEGSTRVTILAQTIKELENGDHTAEAAFWRADGSDLLDIVSQDFTVMLIRPADVPMGGEADDADQGALVNVSAAVEHVEPDYDAMPDHEAAHADEAEEMAPYAPARTGGILPFVIGGAAILLAGGGVFAFFRLRRVI